MKKTSVKLVLFGFSAAAALAVIFYPRVSSADFMSLMSSVFTNDSVHKADELTVPTGNSQTMALLTAPHSPLSATTTKDTLANGAVVEDSALTNENSASATGVTVNPYTSDRISLYTVHPGDTLQQVADMYGVTVSTILWANNMNKGDVLHQGQVIVILPISGLKYTVKKGDTLASIAKAYKADADEITRFNDLNAGAVLTAGDEIIIPNGEITETVPAPSNNGKKTGSSSGGTSTTKKNGRFVAPGDTAAHMSDPNGYFIRPISGGVRTQGIHGNNGVDLASSYGTSIMAAASGQVVISRMGGWNGGYGNYIVIQHSNGTQTLYGHLSQTLVSVGDSVSQGQVIGRMGSTGDSTGVHLHFEVRGGKNPF